MSTTPPTYAVMRTFVPSPGSVSNTHATCVHWPAGNDVVPNTVNPALQRITLGPLSIDAP